MNILKLFVFCSTLFLINWGWDKPLVLACCPKEITVYCEMEKLLELLVSFLFCSNWCLYFFYDQIWFFAINSNRVVKTWQKSNKNLFSYTHPYGKLPRRIQKSWLRYFLPDFICLTFDLDDSDGQSIMASCLDMHHFSSFFC